MSRWSLTAYRWPDISWQSNSERVQGWHLKAWGEKRTELQKRVTWRQQARDREWGYKTGSSWGSGCGIGSNGSVLGWVNGEIFVVGDSIRAWLPREILSARNEKRWFALLLAAEAVQAFCWVSRNLHVVLSSLLQSWCASFTPFLPSMSWRWLWTDVLGAPVGLWPGWRQRTLGTPFVLYPRQQALAP